MVFPNIIAPMVFLMSRGGMPVFMKNLFQLLLALGFGKLAKVKTVDSWSDVLPCLVSQRPPSSPTTAACL